MTKPYLRVLSVTAMENHRLRVALSNGRRGVFDVSPYLDIGIFKQLKDPAYFARVKTLFAGVGWPNGQDLSPLKIADEMRPLPRRKVATRRKPATPRTPQQLARKVA